MSAFLDLELLINNAIESFDKEFCNDEKLFRNTIAHAQSHLYTTGEKDPVIDTEVPVDSSITSINAKI